MITGKRVKEVCQTLAILVIGASICWGLPFAVLASPNSVGTLSAPQNIAATFDEHTASTLPAFSFDDVTQGMLVYQTASGRLMPSLPVDTQVSMQVSGLTNRVSVKQVFSNQTGFVLNGRYLFPLPNEAAVDSLRLHIGERIIEGQIHLKQQAKQIFEQAKAEGKRASLVSQERPNMFTTEVANLAPDEKLVVEISYQETIHYEDGLFSLRFPLVVAPRYIPGLTLGGNQSERVTSSQVFDADRIIAPIRNANSEADPVLKADIKVKLGEGVDKSAVVSPYHPITIDEKQGQLTAALANRVPANRDFVLQWRLKQGTSPVAWVFNQAGKTHTAQDKNASADTGPTGNSSNTDNYSLVMVLPPKVEASEQLNLPRELILVIDTSGSMAGDSIIQAKNALRYALRGLRPQDSFNIIEFNSDVSLLASTPLPATATNLDKARQFVNRLQADGGTEMAQALNAALPRQAFNTASAEDKSLRQVIFMTDGSVGSESALFELIRNQIGDNRLFTVGIGSAPNSHFMQRAAELGRGTFTYIGDVDEVEQKISQLLAKIQYPVLTDLQVRFDDGSVPDYWPAPIPDLYRGEPVLISLKRHPRDPEELVISGRQGHKNWQQSLSLQANDASHSVTDAAQPAAGLDLLWARKQIAALELSKNGANDDKVKEQVTALSLNYHLVSPYTSLVAVDLTPITTNAISRDAVVRQHLPLGWQPMGVLPQTSTSSRFDMLLGGGVLLLALMLALSIRRQQRQQRALSLALHT